jgi:hypothetical protein
MTEEAPKAEEIMQPEAPANAAATEALEEAAMTPAQKLSLSGLFLGGFRLGLINRGRLFLFSNY